MDVTLLYFDGCPHWHIADRRLAQLAAERPDLRLHRHRVDTVQEAERLHFGGSPSIQFDGVDLFAVSQDAVGLSCRLYLTPEGLAGAPDARAAADRHREGVMSRPAPTCLPAAAERNPSMRAAAHDDHGRCGRPLA